MADMTSKRRLRYYCDFCKKSGCNSGCIKRHEQGCCRNPNRICGMCKTKDLQQPDLSELIAILDGADEENAPEKLEQLKTLSNGCPNCILAAIIQSGCQRPMVFGPFDYSPGEGREQDPGFWFPFDYKTERKAFWDKHNEAAVPDAW